MLREFKTHELVRFGPYEVDLRSAELHKHGIKIKLQDRPFLVLSILLREPGTVISRELLRRELWPKETFVDFDHGISTAVNKLRQALCDTAESSRYVETVGRRGYRFKAAVEVVYPLAQLPSNVTPQLVVLPPPSKAGRTHGLRRAAFVGSALAAIALGALAVDWISLAHHPRVLRTTQLTHSGKAEGTSGLHTDGARVYFVERNGTQWPLMQISVAGGEEIPVVMPFPAALVAVSPDRSELLITRSPSLYQEKHPLWIMPIQGGTPHRVGNLEVDQAAWFPDGRRILCVSDSEIFSVDRDGSNRRHLLQTSGVPWNLAWRPDGTIFRYSVGQWNNTSEIWEANADGSNAHPLFPGRKNPPKDCCGVWTPSGKSYIYRSDASGKLDLWAINEPAGFLHLRKHSPVRLTDGPTLFAEPTISPDGKRIFAFGLEFKGSTVRFDRKEMGFVPFLSPVEALDLAFSPDGEWVSYIAPPGATLWRSRIDGSERLQLTSPPMAALRPRWSRDGKQILFRGQAPKSYATAYTIPADGGTPSRLIENDPFSREYMDWSPDGKSVVIGVEPELYPETGITAVNLRTHEISEFPGSKGLRTPRWSPTGNYLAATSQDAKHIFFYDPLTQKWKQAATAIQVARLEWERDGSHLYYQDIRAPGEAVFRLDPKTGKTAQFKDFSKLIQSGAMRCGFEGFAPDGSLIGSVRSGWADVYALDVELP